MSDELRLEPDAQAAQDARQARERAEAQARFVAFEADARAAAAALAAGGVPLREHQFRFRPARAATRWRRANVAPVMVRGWPAPGPGRVGAAG